MSTAYVDPVMLDSTGQDIVDKLDSIATLMGDGVIDDTSTATDKTWSAEKLNTLNGDVNAKISWSDAENSVKKNYWNNDLEGHPALNVGGYGSVTYSDHEYTIVAPAPTGGYNFGIKWSKELLRSVFANMAGKSAILSFEAKAGVSWSAQLGLDSSSPVTIGTSYTKYAQRIADLSQITNIVFLNLDANSQHSFNVKNIMISLEGVPRDYVPYIPDNTELVSWSANAMLGAKNILPIKLSEVKASNTTGTWSGNTYTISDVAVEFTTDGGYVTQIKLNGTASANITTLFLNTHLNIKAGSYKCNGNPSGVTGNQYGLRIATANFSVNTFFEQDATLNLANDTSDLRVDIRIPSGQVIDNEIFKPMIRLASDTDSTYAPYAMTNEELTKAVIKRTTGTATTSANGNFNTNLRVDECVVIGAYPTGTGADYALIPYRWDGTYWGLSARKPLTTWDVPANTQIDYIIWYAEV